MVSRGRTVRDDDRRAAVEPLHAAQRLLQLRELHVPIRRRPGAASSQACQQVGSEQRVLLDVKKGRARRDARAWSRLRRDELAAEKPLRRGKIPRPHEGHQVGGHQHAVARREQVSGHLRQRPRAGSVRAGLAPTRGPGFFLVFLQ